MRPHGTPKQLQTRRERAIALLQSGKTYQSIAATLNSSISSIVRWAQAHRKGGMKALQPKTSPGRPPLLTLPQKHRLLRLLVKGSLSEGYTTDLWTLPRISKLIAKYFGTRYHPGHAWRIMRGLGWTCQKPERRALQRDESTIEHWKKYDWPRIKKTSKTWSPSRLPR